MMTEEEDHHQLSSVLYKAIEEGAPLYNNGDIQGCYNVYALAAQVAAAMAPASSEAETLKTATFEAAEAKDAKESAWIMRRCFDAILALAKPEAAGGTESLSDLLKRTIRQGAPMYDKGDQKGCYELYMEAAKYAGEQGQLALSAVGQLLEQATEEATPLGDAGDFDEAAWVLRRSFDDILAQVSESSSQGIMSPGSRTVHGALLRSTGAINLGEEDDPSNDSSNGYSYWQDEKIQNTSDFEIGSFFSDVAFILRASIEPATHKRFTGKTYPDSFQGIQAVEVLTGLGLARNRKMAVSKCTMLLAGSFLIPVSHENESTFSDGTHLYRFPDREELQAALFKLLQGTQPEGSLQAQLVIALQNTLDLSLGDNNAGGDSEASPTFADVSTKHILSRRPALLPEQSKGITLAHLAIQAERVIDIQARKHLLKTYEKCFVGKEAVTKLVEEKIVRSKEESIQLMRDLSGVGLIHHVLYEHGFEDGYLFYRFTSPGDLRKSLDAIAILSSTPTSGQELVRQTALNTRYQQFADLDVASILNSFFGCDDEAGWDLVDLQNWRNNMKRWGFGRPEDQDHEMLDKLSPLSLNVDPETWYDSLSEEEREKWESPWGILAQIAIFDQVTRSAYRGTPAAFKWDVLAIKASKVAIERGYFETAYKSTLCQFLILLPLEHSESWEDQKLGVTLLLRLLSTVAVQDEGLSDYEIVKRLEFSKRLTTAFLEHAQVIAKFKRYPHRNKANSRTTSLEERVWLASDLVPRWAKSQNPDDGRKNVIQLPVIPLKKLTRK